jgi:hypothetical protein
MARCRLGAAQIFVLMLLVNPFRQALARLNEQFAKLNRYVPMKFPS